MQVREVIDQSRKERGMTIAELARRAGIKYDSLYFSLKGDRKIPATEFVSLCKLLDLKVEDFSD